MIDEYSIVKLTKPIPNCDIPPGTRGVVVMVHQGSPPGYEVEFVDDSGKTLCDPKTGHFVFTLEEHSIEIVR